jgi:hypothetical protein
MIVHVPERPRGEAEMNEREPLSHYIFHHEIRMHHFFLFEFFFLSSLDRFASSVGRRSCDGLRIKTTPASVGRAPFFGPTEPAVSICNLQKAAFRFA